MSCCKGKNNLSIIAHLSEKVWWIDNNILFRTKLRNITRDDAIQFARENGIRRPDAIATIIDHLKLWGEWEEASIPSEQIINGYAVSNIRIEQAYKGNFHLLATIDGQERKFVIGKNKEEFALIEKTGIANLTEEQLKAMAETYFKLSE